MDTNKELTMTLVSIIVPIYNTQEYLAKCLDSLVKQTYKNIEIILVDDGSLDQCLSICKAFAQKDTRIKIITQKNSGVASARINGFLHSTGELIMFVDSDDYISNDMVRSMLDTQQKYLVDMVCSQYYDVIDEKIVVTPIRPEPGYYDKKKLKRFLSEKFLYDKSTRLAGITGFLCTRLIKRNFVQAALDIGRNLIHSEDQLGLFVILSNINNMYVMREPLYYYVKRTGQATSVYNEKYWHNFEDFFSKLKECDKNNYLSTQLPERAVMTLKGLIKMEYENKNLSFINQYLSLKRNFSENLYSLSKTSTTTSERLKERFQYYLVMHRCFFAYGVFIYLNKILKKIVTIFKG